MSLSAKSQAALIIEDLEGTTKTPSASNVLEVLTDSFPNVINNNEFIERQVARGTLSKVLGMAGGRDARATLMMEMAGKTGAFGEPGFSIPLRACGMKFNSACRKLTIKQTWNAGSFVLHGTLLTTSNVSGSISGGTGSIFRVIGDYFRFGAFSGGDTYLVCELISGTPGATDLFLHATAPATAIIDVQTGGLTGANIANAQAWEPQDDEVSVISHGAVTAGPFVLDEVVTGATSGASGRVAGGDLNASGTLQIILNTGSVNFANAEVITGATSAATTTSSSTMTQLHNPSLTIWSLHGPAVHQMKGARGNWSLDVKNRDRPVFSFEFTGAGLPATEAGLFPWSSSGIKNLTPPTVVGQTLLFGLQNANATFSPLYGQMTYKSNNQLALRDAPSDPGGSSSGYLSARITNRRYTVDIDFETVAAGVWPLETYHHGKTEFRIVQKFPSAVAGNSFEIRCRAAQIASQENRDKDGILQAGATFQLSSLTTTNGNATGSPVNDELVILQY